ncbi:MAG: hypothetical protein J1D88_03125 [Treponema sp.]|nr:hypothetical protein [Treponema sp.]
MKKNLAVLAVCLLFQNVWAATGILTGQKHIRSVSTTWFDIIFPEASAQTALELASEADSIYQDICHGLGIEPQFRMPVVITPSVQVFNAYFTNFDYNHIVLYDGLPEPSMQVSSEYVLSTFRHELTHAVTINLRNGFWRTIDSVFGDVLNWGGYVVMPTLIKEGAAVAYESGQGEGRLNDDWYLHMVRQAKLQNDFPSAPDVAGARDVFPWTNASYAFGGPFVDWLQKQYGMERYADFWYRAINMKAITYSQAFKGAYGIPLKEAWLAFKQYVFVPDIPSNPLLQNGVSDFYTEYFSRTVKENGSTTFSRKNSIGARYTSLASCNTGIAFIEDCSSSVWFARYGDNGELQKPRKLFTLANMNNIALSHDGAFLAVSLYCINHAGTKQEVKVYSMQTGHWLNLHEQGLRNAVVVHDPAGYMLAAIQAESQQARLVLYRLELSGTRRRSAVSATLVGSIDFPRSQQPSYLIDSANGTVACWYKSGMSWSLRTFTVMDTNKIDFTDYPLPEGIRPRGLSLCDSSDDELVFSFAWTQAGTFPRLGFMHVLREGVSYCVLQQQDISGGVYTPVPIRHRLAPHEPVTVAYAGNFVSDCKLLVMDCSLHSFVTTEKIAALSPMAVGNEKRTNGDDGAEDAASSDDAREQLLLRSKPYRAPYYHKGTLAPFSLVPVYNYDGTIKSRILFPGATWITNNPWDGDHVAFSSGFDPVSKAGGAMVAFLGRAGTSLYNYSAYPAVVFDAEGFRQVTNELSFSSGIRLGKVLSLLMSEYNFGFYGRENITVQYTVHGDTETVVKKSLQTQTNMYHDENRLSLKISSIHAVGSGPFEQFGFSLMATYRTVWFGAAEYDAHRFYQNLFPTVQLSLPRLLPFHCVQGFTYNLPVTAQASLTADDSTFLFYTAQVVLFSAEIQKGIPFFPVYCNRLVTSLSYTGSFKHTDWENFAIARAGDIFSRLSELPYDDSVSLKVTLQSAVNTGALASPDFVWSLGAAFVWYPHAASGKTPFAVKAVISLPLAL